MSKRCYLVPFHLKWLTVKALRKSRVLEMTGTTTILSSHSKSQWLLLVGITYTIKCCGLHVTRYNYDHKPDSYLKVELSL